ncbi:helix-turn-helix domain-containing protein [Sphingomonas ginsenosidivorax]|uniref:Helix-turn-helix domain-containing protein n=1 Tax=Sphingomonas ginsenosidivorax TaxID=862135 RepID=A0A5C6UC07_9SPHN|nr:AraC family transcriptional regulator [Sphingomonas ginsenosidivorax]TXC70239.1 helix-turn-helix domain-containing protein [Sphingomonas ginsenosidivorax]
MEDTYTRSAFEAELQIPHGVARIMRFANDRPTNHVFRRDTHYWLDLCLTPRPEQARGCYTERWGPHRFERLGEIFLVPPGEALHVRTEAGHDQASIACEIHADAVDRWLDHPLEWTDRRLEGGLDIVQPYIRACLSRLAEETRHGGTGRKRLAALIAGQLAIELARYLEAIAEGPITGGLASWRLRLIDERLHRTGPPPSLGELAEICNVSVRQLTRGFRSSRGCTIGDHIAQTRIEMAKRALGEAGSIKSIAFALGFASPSSFSHAFGRATGITPLQFRQRHLRARD